MLSFIGLCFVFYFLLSLILDWMPEYCDGVKCRCFCNYSKKKKKSAQSLDAVYCFFSYTTMRTLCCYFEVTIDCFLIAVSTCVCLADQLCYDWNRHGNPGTNPIVVGLLSWAYECLGSTDLQCNAGGGSLFSRDLRAVTLN